MRGSRRHDTKEVRKSAAGTEDVPQFVHAMIRDQAKRSPDSVALVHEGKELSYRELDERTDQLSRFLRNRGVGPDVMVGVSMERSFDMVFAVLGILKAGGAYVPLDPAYPRERLSVMIADSGIRLLLTQRRLLGALPAGTVELFPLDAGWGDVAAAGEPETPAPGLKPGNLAYMIYTSGSTGIPKGVLIEHHSLADYVRSAQTFLKMHPSDRLLQFASLNFDASAEEIYCTLAAGATLVLRTDAMLASTAEFLRRCTEWGITVLDLPTAFWHMLALDIDREKSGLPPSVRLVIIGGERALPERMSRWVNSQAGKVRLINGYGPTETTIASTMWEWDPARSSSFTAGSVPIGVPIPGVTAYVVDSEGKAVADGEVGELYIGGFGVARGYLNQPDLTEQRFVPDPFGGPGRVYKTGDRVRRQPGGILEFVGRVDHQVKIRGFRIELGEIEAALEKCATLRQAVVTAREHREGDMRLVAYVVPRNGGVDVSGLRTALRELLPEYMIPSAFVMMDALPLTPGGKVDMRALPEPQYEREAKGTPFVAPRTAGEKALAAIWCELLGIPEASVHDQFLELGGHSLLAAQLIARVRDELRVELTLRDVFDHSTIASMAERLERVRAEGRRTEGPAAHRFSRPADIPLSFAQESVWFFLQLHPTNVAYNSQAYLRLKGELNEEALQRALTELVRRHEIFRTTFHEADGRAVQRIQPPYEYPLHTRDLEVLPEDRREEAARRAIREEICTPFDLAALPLVRWKLLRLGPREHILTVVEHHFVHDGWSFNLLLSEVRDLYNAFLEGKPSPLEEPPIQFADFVLWQREWMKSEEALNQIAYWKERLRGSPPLLELPTDRPRPTQQNLHGASLSVDLPETLYTALREFSREQGTSLFMTMLAGFIALLHRYSGMDDFCIGCGVANRRHKETEKVLGMIVNTVAIRSNFAGEPTFLDLLAQTRETSLAAFAHQDVPFEKVVEAIQPKRSLSYLPIYQVMFGFHDSPLSERGFSGLSAELVETLSNGSAKSDLNVIVIPRSEQHVGQRNVGMQYGITINWEYNSDLFDAGSMERMLRHYERILRQIVAHPAIRVSEIPLLTGEEREETARGWNATQVEYPRDKSIVDLFEEQASRTPDATALQSGESTWSYDELNRRGNQVAHRLRRLGVGRGDIVGLLVERGPEAIAGILGTLKAGAAYLPLDPALPEERLRYMVEDANTELLIVQDGFAAPEWFRGKTETLSRACGQVAEEPSGNIAAGISGDDLAYVMYTSGSTGRPKGVEVVHRGVVRLAKNPNYAGFGPDETMFQFAPLFFDASTFEIWCCLLNGGRLAICSPARPSVQELGEEIERQGVTTLWLTSALFEQMIDEQLERLHRVRQLLSGGDVLSPRHARAFLGRYPGSRLVNCYGPTENTTFTTCNVMTDESDARETLPIGRPISNTEVYILDRSLQLVPVGVAGELYTGGDGLARGYLGRPELTGERFVPNPFGPPGSRLYRTGDLCRYDSDGRVEFIGRMDNQVKLRGYRVELGEVESVLRENAGVREAAVIVEGSGGEKRLVAYCVPARGTTLDGAALRTYMTARVPSYMVPSAIGIVDSLPLTPTGKVDRNALPAVAVEIPAQGGSPAETSLSPVQKVVARVWGDILGVERIGLHDNFFDLGGHSLMATQVVSRLLKVTGVELPLARFFEGPTVAELAALLEEKMLEKLGQP